MASTGRSDRLPTPSLRSGLRPDYAAPASGRPDYHGQPRLGAGDVLRTRTDPSRDVQRAYPGAAPATSGAASTMAVLTAIQPPGDGSRRATAGSRFSSQSPDQRPVP